MDAITNGLDTATTFDIINATRSLADILDQTFVISLLQPPPEVFNLFDEIILMSEGNIIYHGMYVFKYSIHIYSHV
jgi:ABC-type multidrug transport system ATPase subunit